MDVADEKLRKRIIFSVKDVRKRLAARGAYGDIGSALSVSAAGWTFSFKAVYGAGEPAAYEAFRLAIPTPIQVAAFPGSMIRPPERLVVPRTPFDPS